MTRRAVALTRRGWTVAGAAAGLLVAGRLLGAEELTVLGLAAYAILVGACGWVVCTRRVFDVTRVVVPTRMHVGDAARADLVVTASGPAPAVDVTESIDHDRLRASFAFAPLAQGTAASAPYRVPTEHRGELVLGPTTVVRSDALGLAQVRRVVAAAETVLVRPRVHPIAPPVRSSGTRTAFEEDTSTRAPTADAGGDFLAVRPYEVGDDPRRVHWRSSARFDDELVVRQYVAPRRGRTVVILDTREAPHGEPRPASGPTRDPAFERAVEAAASIVTALGRADRPVECVTTGGTVLAPSGCDTRRAIDRLATITGDEADVLVAVTARQTRRPPDHAVLVTARHDAAIHAAHRLLASRAQTTLVVTGGSAPERAHETVVDARTTAFPDAWGRADPARAARSMRARPPTNTAALTAYPTWTSAGPSRPPSPSPR